MKRVEACLMEALVLPTIIFVLLFGPPNHALAADVSSCGKVISGPLVIAGAENECLPSEYCFGMTDYDDALRFRMGMYHLGGNYYTLSGIEFDQYGNPNALSGSAVKIDDSLLMSFTIVSTAPEEEIESYIMSKMGTIRIDLKTSDISFAMIDVKAYADGSEHVGDSYESLEFIMCPLPAND